MKYRTIEELISDLKYCKCLLKYEYRREHKIAPSWLYERIHQLEKQIKEKKNEIHSGS